MGRVLPLLEIGIAPENGERKRAETMRKGHLATEAAHRNEEAIDQVGGEEVVGVGVEEPVAVAMRGAGLVPSLHNQLC